MQLSILIRNYNEAEALKKTLRLLQKQKVSFPYEIVVSDNKSTDDSVAVAQSFGCRVVHNNAKVFSYGQLLNFGIENCKGEFVLLMSAHVALLNEDAIEKMIAPFADSKVACVTGVSATNLNTIMDAVEPKYFTLADFKDIDSWENWKLYEPYLFEAPCGAIRKTVWQQLRFDETLEITEDRHWGRQLLKQGFKSVYGAGCYYFYFAARKPSSNRKRLYAESLVMKRVFGRAEKSNDFYSRSFKTICSQVYHSIINGFANLYNLFKIYAIRFKKKK